MSAVNPKPQEPSMEEILASIRRIIADDQEVARTPAARPAPVQAAPPPRPAPPPPEPIAAEVLELAAVVQPVRAAGRHQPVEGDLPEIDLREQLAAGAVGPGP
jgi:cell pole-organizing protein PopZ